MAAVQVTADVTMKDRINLVRKRIDQAAQRAGRSSADVTLIGVCKTWPVDDVASAMAAGITDLGENRVQEAVAKIVELGEGPVWHLIGGLQTNKAKSAVDHFHLIHSVDRLELARAVASRAVATGRTVRILIQVNVAERSSQGGVAAGELSALFRKVRVIPGLSLDGLMCIAPDVHDLGSVEGTRPYFKHLAQLHGELQPEAITAGHPWRHLSMGMTGDFEVGVEEGATLVRVGRAIFGERRP
ncbi:MAG: YggS family pyridoxal phosphate-dependent enzyme [Chloroflexi bacterium]|nr:YggS family pyridoxal phosphate-dependent enzyme [Chloroflexota bacterium]